MQFTGGTEPTVPMRVYAKTYEEIKRVAYEQHVSLPEALYRIIQGTSKEGSEAEIIRKLAKENEKFAELVESYKKLDKNYEEQIEYYKEQMEHYEKQIENYEKQIEHYKNMNKISEEQIAKYEQLLKLVGNSKKLKDSD